MRKSGILMHITSLPGPYGVGSLGKSAYEFIDFLKAAGQSCWQLLPVNPTGHENSPYQSFSSMAGNPYLIDLDALVEEGMLEQEDLDGIHWGDREEQVDFAALWENRMKVLRLAYERFDEHEQLDAFVQQHSDWLPDVALYMALKDENGGKPWYEWPEPLKNRDFQAIWDACDRLSEQTRFYSFVQYVFSDQWIRMRAYADSQGIELIGDVPFYVPMDSVDVWSAPDLFLLESDMTPSYVSGCPADAYAPEGQLWGHPMYCWEEMLYENYYWWLHRLDMAGSLFDYIRLDHFRGFEAGWAVPYGETSAQKGHWEKGPGMELLEMVKYQLPQLKLIAEDLGTITPEVQQLREATGWPGMQVLQFSQELSADGPHTYEENTVCYTGTHDNMTLRAWLENADEATREQLGDVWGAIAATQKAKSRLCIVPMQDYLELGEEARMNVPGKASGNWTWRMLPGSCTAELAQKILEVTREGGRLPE